ncbi:MAG: helix-turn-helix transcriptional regulator [Clostridia bacterium]|nr:helix-turn-helix transcriptional regulator [Clostridia bacterium]
MNNDNIIIGQRIRRIRSFQKLSREKLAEKANISTQFLADIETGKKGMTVSTLKKLCGALCVSADSIIFGTEADSADDNLNAMLDSVPEDKKDELAEIIQMIIRYNN